MSFISFALTAHIKVCQNFFIIIFYAISLRIINIKILYNIYKYLHFIELYLIIFISNVRVFFHGDKLSLEFLEEYVSE